MIAQARASHAQSYTHAQCAETQEWRNRDYVVVTMALVSDFSHPESIILLKAILTDSVRGKSLLVELFRSDADTCVLPNDATCTRHDGAFSSKRVTVPCDSDFLCVSLIRDGLASQHACSPTVLNTISLINSSAAQNVF